MFFIESWPKSSSLYIVIDLPQARKRFGKTRRLGRIASAFLFCLFTLALASAPAVAFDLGEWVPGLKLSPFLSERVEYETNVFQVPSHSQGDVIFKTIPGILVDYTFGPHSLSAGYRAEILNYATLTSQNNTHQIAAGLLRLDFPRTLINVRDDFARTSDPPGTELTGPILSTTNFLKPEAEYRLTPTFSVGANSSWLHQRFDEASTGDLIDRDEYLFGASVFWKFLPKTDLSLNYYYGWTNFTHASDRNYTQNSVTLALRGDITAKLSSTFRVGYTVQSADHSGQVAFSGWTTGGETVYRPTDRTTISLATLRTSQASTDGLNPYYVTTSATLAAQHQLLPKLSVGARVGVGMNDYPDKDTINGKTDWRQDTFSLVGVQATYDIQPWLRVGLEYIRIGRDSNFPSFRFVDERISGHVTVQF
jgi:Putative beta-barrel porin 2